MSIASYRYATTDINLFVVAFLVAAIKAKTMLTKSDFQNLPSYKLDYAHGEQVFCIPTWGKGNNPIHAIVCETWPRDPDHILVWTAEGEVEVDVAYCRPGNAEIVVAWLNALKADGELQGACTLPFLTTPDYEVTVICEQPEPAQ